MNKEKNIDPEELKDKEQTISDLHTEGPLSEKDEVKQAEDRTSRNQSQDSTRREK